MSGDQIKGEGYSVNRTGGVYVFRGTIRLGSQEEYAPIIELLGRALAEQQPRVQLDLRDLQYLNSSGLYMLSQYVVRLRDAGRVEVSVLASKKIFWQGKSLRNMLRLMPALSLSFE